MPNAKQHAVLGAACGAGFALLLYLDRKLTDPSAKFDWGELLFFSGTGTAAALLPDILDPATHPGHRTLFHSVGAGLLLTYGLWGKPSEKLSTEMRLLLRVAGMGYLSHLAMDSTTPSGLPALLSSADAAAI